MKDDFDNARRMPGPDIATKAELDHRIANRARPALRPELTPGGALVTRVHRQVDQEGEQRIAELRARLKSKHDGMRQELSLNANRGRARSGFERVR